MSTYTKYLRSFLLDSNWPEELEPSRNDLRYLVNVTMVCTYGDLRVLQGNRMRTDYHSNIPIEDHTNCAHLVAVQRSDHLLFSGMQLAILSDDVMQKTLTGAITTAP